MIKMNVQNLRQSIQLTNKVKEGTLKGSDGRGWLGRWSVSYKCIWRSTIEKFLTSRLLKSTSFDRMWMGSTNIKLFPDIILISIQDSSLIQIQVYRLKPKGVEKVEKHWKCSRICLVTFNWLLMCQTLLLLLDHKQIGFGTVVMGLLIYFPYFPSIIDNW